MKKDRFGIHDYALAAFGRVARLGFPTVRAQEERIREDVRRKMAMSDPAAVVIACENAIRAREAILCDIRAFCRMVETLEAEGKAEVVEALKAIYCDDSADVRKRNVITYRVRKFAREHYMDERTVKRWLAYALMLFAKYRGLVTIEEEDFEWLK